jgi:hypothetical protein
LDTNILTELLLDREHADKVAELLHQTPTSVSLSANLRFILWA